MSRPNDSMIYPKVEDLLARVDSKFSLVTLAAYRARQINSYFNQLGEGLGHSIPPQVSSVARKPLSIAFEEIAADKIVKIDRLPYEEMELEAAEIFGEIPEDGAVVAEVLDADDVAEVVEVAAEEMEVVSAVETDTTEESADASEIESDEQ
jgi:DNA-directed RNA polymerase subunit omega